MNIFQKSQKIVLILGLFFGLMSCEEDEIITQTSSSSLVEHPVQEHYNLNARQGVSKFSFAKNKVVEGDDWDIAFDKTFIMVNGGQKNDFHQPNRTGQAGLYLVNSPFEQVSIFDEKLLKQDHATGFALDFGHNRGWYSRDSNGIISALPNRTLVIKTHDGQWVKMQILSYYNGLNSNPAGRVLVEAYYTFKYQYYSSKP